MFQNQKGVLPPSTTSFLSVRVVTYPWVIDIPWMNGRPWVVHLLNLNQSLVTSVFSNVYHGGLQLLLPRGPTHENIPPIVFQ